MGNDVRIAITGNTSDAEAALRRLRAEASNTQGLDKLRGALLHLAPAAIPLASQLAPIAAGAAAAGVATVAFTAAIIPQISAVSDAAKAQDKANDAIQKYGANSKQAQAATKAAYDQMRALPPATQKAAEAFVIAKKDFNDWSNALAKNTMPVFTKGLADATALLPKLNGLVEGSSKQFDRLVTLIGGDISSPGFDRIDKEFTDFANKTLTNVINGIIHLNRELAAGKADGPFAKIMDYAHQTGPEVAKTLEDLAKALANVGEAAAQAGPGMLTVVDALAKLVASVPPDVLARLLQVATVFKLVSLASAGLAVTSVRVAELGRSLNQMRTAASAASGASASLGAAWGTLSTGARLGITIGLVTALGLTLKHFIDAGKAATLSADTLGTNLRQLGAEGKAPTDSIEKLRTAVKNLNFDAGGSFVKDDSIVGILFGSGKKSSAESTIKNVDKALAQLVQDGNASTAAAALKKLTESGVNIPSDKLKQYNSALADAKYEAELAAESQGMFGKQAQQVSAALDKQARAAQGLHDAIFALNDVNRAALDAESAYQAALDDTTAAIKTHKNALKAATIEQALGTQKGREAYDVLSKLSSSAQEAADAALKQGKSQDYANRILINAHAELVTAGRAMGLTTQQANALADQLDSIKDPKIRVTANIMDLQAKAKTVEQRIDHLAKLKPTPKVLADIRSAQKTLSNLNAQINKLNKTVHVTLKVGTAGMPADVKNNYGFAKGGPVGAAASGGPRSNLTWVGENGPELVDLAPGSLVHPAANSRTMAAGGGGGGGVARLEFVAPAGSLESALWVHLRQWIRLTYGGDVQRAIGRG